MKIKELKINKLYRQAQPFTNFKLVDHIQKRVQDGTFTKGKIEDDEYPYFIESKDVFGTTTFGYESEGMRDQDYSVLESCAERNRYIEKCTLQIAHYITDEPDVLERDLKKAGTLESLRYIDDYEWIMPVISKLEEEGYSFIFNKSGCSISDPHLAPIATIKKEANGASTFFWAAIVALNHTISVEQEKPKAIITIRDGAVTSIQTNIPDFEAVVIDYDVDGIDTERLDLVKFQCEDSKWASINIQSPKKLSSSEMQFVWRQCFDNDDKEPVVIEMTDENKGLHSIYAESGQAIENDFESYGDAETWAIENNYRIVESFNL